jgi:hypothetical protein
MIVGREKRKKTRASIIKSKDVTGNGLATAAQFQYRFVHLPQQHVFVRVRRISFVQGFAAASICCF